MMCGFEYAFLLESMNELGRTCVLSNDNMPACSSILIVWWSSFFSAAAMNRVSKLFLPLIYKPQSGEYKKDLSSKAHRVSEWRYGSADWWPHSIDSDDYTPNLWVVDAGAGTNQINIIWWLLLLDADASKIPREMHQFNRSLHGVCRWSKDDHTDVDGDKFAEKIWLVVRHRHWVNRPMAPM